MIGSLTLFVVPFAQCPAPAPAFAPTDLDGSAATMLQHDDGSGRELFVGGTFVDAGDVVASNVAKWNGSRWATLGDGTNAGVSALVRFNDGSGTQLFAGGAFTLAGGIPASRVARWDGASWHPVGMGFDGSVFALAVWNDGSGAALYAAGEFGHSGAQVVDGIARWDGVAWQPVGGGIHLGGGPGIVRALTVHDDGLGGGTALYAGGRFGAAGATPVNNLARWNGTSWSGLGAGVTWVCCSTGIYALESFDEGSGPRLFAGGSFMQAGGSSAYQIARWNGASWSTLPQVWAFEYAEVFDMLVADVGSGPSLYVAGENVLDPAQFTGNPYLVRWDGSQWHALGAGVGFAPTTLATYDDGSGPKLHAGGWFSEADGHYAGRIARFDDPSWTSLDVNDGVVGTVRAATTFDFGGGVELVAGGSVTRFALIDANVARWNGSAWTAMSAPLSLVRTFGVHDLGSGPELYIGGNATGAATLLRWNGSAWDPVPGAPTAPGVAHVSAIASYDDGSGHALYVAGRFLSAGSVSAKNVARFDGTTWSAVGAEVFDDNVLALSVLDDGSGTKLYAGGIFRFLSSAPAPCVARWDGVSWQSFGAGLDPTGSVVQLVRHDDAFGPGLVALGAFATAGGVPAQNIARWDGSVWSPMGAPFFPSATSAAALFDAGDGQGTDLFVVGGFTASGATSPTGLARWDGAQWGDVSGGFETSFAAGFPSGLTLTPHDDGNGPALFVGGSFVLAGGVPAANLARYASCGETGRTACYGDGSGTACPCGNASAVGANVGCLHSFGQGGKLRATGFASTSNDTLQLVGSDMPSSTVLYFQGTTLVAGGAGATFGDGLRCAGGVVRRLDMVTNVAGGSQIPGPGQPSISVDGGATAGSTRFYQAWYRNAATFCTSATFNLTNALEIEWGA